MEIFSALKEFVRAHPSVFSSPPCMLQNAPLSDYSSMQVGGTVELAVFPADVWQLSLLCPFLKKRGIRITTVGRGTNTLFASEHLDGVLLSLASLRVKRRLRNRIFLGAGLPISDACHFALENGLTGMEELYGIPGTVGGAVAMNAGAFGHTVSDLSPKVYYIDAFTGKPHALDSTACLFGYRDSRFLRKNDSIIFAVSFLLEQGEPELIAEKMNSYAERRRSTQPLSFPSLGSVFKRPPSGYAARYIEDAGLKGCTVGGASVSEKHAGFIVNHGSATANDILKLIEKIQAEVYSRFSVSLEPEIRIVR